MPEKILLQWTYTDRTAPLSEYVLTRILEHHGLSQPTRSTIQLRTFRTTAGAGRILTTLTYPHLDETRLVVDDEFINVRPSSAVLPLLTSLLSPFVMGLTKTARAAASTTAEIPRPTTLPGTPLLLTSITFSDPSLTIHTLPSPTAPTIFLEAEERGFLDECLPDFGERKYFKGHELVLALRQGGFI